MLAAAALWIALSGGLPMACPVCDSEQGRAVRDGVLNEDLGSNLARVLLPFPVLAGLIGLLYLALPDSPASGPEENRREDA